MDYESLAKVRAAKLLLYNDPKKAAKDLYDELEKCFSDPTSSEKEQLTLQTFSTKVMEILQTIDPEYSKEMLIEYLKCAASVLT
jgi:lauroyl/myristoyl acyltransferase